MNQIYIQNISDSLQSTAVPAMKLMKHNLFERHSIPILVTLSKIVLLEPERVSTFFVHMFQRLMAKMLTNEVKKHKSFDIDQWGKVKYARNVIFQISFLFKEKTRKYH